MKMLQRLAEDADVDDKHLGRLERGEVPNDKISSHTILVPLSKAIHTPTT
ncbi:hypothetical protein [Oceanobacillus sp. CF4.6]